jgi:multiple sugar transport system ATP-binding protein
MGRALVREPTLFLFDEPLSNLDAKLRVEMRAEIKRLHQRLQTSIVYVTHDQIEAMTLADKIVVLRDGRVEQVGSPRDLYERPANTFVAQFIGSPKMNLLPADIAPLLTGATAMDAAAETIGIRPEHLTVVEPRDGTLRGTVGLCEYTGAVTLLHVKLPDGHDCLVLHDGHDTKAGIQIGLTADVSKVHFFKGNGQTTKRTERGRTA